MRTVNRQIKLISKIDACIKETKRWNLWIVCQETGEPIGLKRLIARPIATLSISCARETRKRRKNSRRIIIFISGIFSPVFKQSYPFFTARSIRNNFIPSA